MYHRDRLMFEWYHQYNWSNPQLSTIQNYSLSSVSLSSLPSLSSLSPLFFLHKLQRLSLSSRTSRIHQLISFIPYRLFCNIFLLYTFVPSLHFSSGQGQEQNVTRRLPYTRTNAGRLYNHNKGNLLVFLIATILPLLSFFVSQYVLWLSVNVLCLSSFHTNSLQTKIQTTQLINFQEQSNQAKPQKYQK